MNMGKTSDICFLLEGTYPYVAGGVSTWVHQLISSLHHYTFSLAVILPSEKSPRRLKYDVPPNVI
ncbi:DUF3492 domain-containing protein, partial [bacterium]|nr:DUF3492 domain-containing protein [bacterium]